MVFNVAILGAAGRDFHNFNVKFRDNTYYNVVCFTATQIPGINGRKYPKELAGKLYPNGIPIFKEEDLESLVEKHSIDVVYFSYSDVSHEYVMHKACFVNSLGCEFRLLGTQTQLKSNKFVVSICAVRTGSGKSQVARRVASIYKDQGYKVVIVRHPMPYADLYAQRVQRFENYSDLDKHKCTIEEREEYEPHIDTGTVLFAGVDYGLILAQAEKEADVIIWDGGNNDIGFFKPDILMCVVDPLRASHTLSYYPGEINIRMAEIIVINKENVATEEQKKEMMAVINKANPKAKVVHADSVLTYKKQDLSKKKILVIEDGPTTTHGNMAFGAGYIGAKQMGATDQTIVKPHKYAVGYIKEVFKKFDHLKLILPAMGYGGKMVKDLESTINAVECDLIVSGTPIDLTRILKPNKEIIRIGYDLDDQGQLKKLLANSYKKQ